MDAQTLNYIIYGLSTVLFGLLTTLIFSLRKKVENQDADHKLEMEKVRGEIEKDRSEIRMRELAQETAAKQFADLVELVRSQIAVGNKMAENFQMDAERRYVHEQQGHELIKQFTNEQSKTVGAIQGLSDQVGTLNGNVQLAATDTKATRQLSIEIDKTVDGLTNEIQKQNDSFMKLRNEIVTMMEKVLKQPTTEDVRSALQEAEQRILQHIDNLKISQTSIISEVKADEATN